MAAFFVVSHSRKKHNTLNSKTLYEQLNFAIFPNEIPFPRKYAILRASVSTRFNI